MNAGLNHLQQGVASYLDLLFEDGLLSIVNNKTNKTIYSTEATSGDGIYMNNPAGQHIVGLGTIPEGDYYYLNSD